MEKIYIVTGAAGHLGGSVARELLSRGGRVRALVMPGESGALEDANGALEIFQGDVRRPDTLKDIFAPAPDACFTVIHCAGIISIARRVEPLIREVNVGGTKNIIEKCMESPGCRLVYVSSVHALPLLPWGSTMREIDRFDPERVTGAYAKTKAEASQLVLDAAAGGLDAVIVHPGGIIGPHGNPSGNMTSLVLSYLRGRLPGGVKGGYDFVDVRDVTAGVLAAADRGRAGECYLLSNRFIDLREFFGALSDVSGKKPLKTYFPIWLAKTFAPFSEAYYRLSGKTPIYTAYSLYTLSSNAIYSHEKASRELGYKTRELRETLRDTVQWMKDLPSAPTKRRGPARRTYRRRPRRPIIAGAI